MSQLLLLPDPRPLVEKLGPAFFQSAPEAPGVYLMRDHAGTAIYVGKARNLRRRLCSYRVANPDRMRKRHLRLLSRVVSIELELCAGETAALEREAHLIRTLKPRFNRAGTWSGPKRFLTWRVEPAALVLDVKTETGGDEAHFGPLGLSAVFLRAALARLLWSALNPGHGCSELPAGWFAGRHAGETALACQPGQASDCAALLAKLADLDYAAFEMWILERCGSPPTRFDENVRAADLELLSETLQGRAKRAARQPGPL